MATNQAVNTINMAPVSAAIAVSRFVEITANGVQQVGTIGNDAVGVSYAASAASNTDEIAIAVYNGGIVKVEAGAAIAKGAAVMANATGQAITATGANGALGYANSAVTASGEIVEVILTKKSADFA